MKYKQFTYTLLWSLIMILGLTVLTGCSKDDFMAVDAIYQGHIENIYNSSFTVKVTESTSDCAADRPCVKDVISVDLSDFPDLKLKADLRITFIIKTIEPTIVLTTISDYEIWNCKIKILKIE